MLTFDDMNLKDNPFSIAPTRLVWADRKGLKEKLEKHLSFSIVSKPSTISAIFWGKWGAGKTFSMKYFSQESVLKELAKKAKQEKIPFVINMVLPMKDVFDTFYLKIIDDVWMACLKDELLDYIKKLNLTERSKKREAFSRLNIDKKLVEVFSTGNIEFITQYLNMTASASALKKQGIPRGIQTTNDKFDVIRSLFNLLCKIKYSSIIIWIDDAERAELLSAKDLAELQTLLRDLIDHVPENLKIIMNITPKPGMSREDVLYYLGEPVQRRISEVIEVEELSEEDFWHYVKDLLKEYRKEDTPNEYFPFEKDAIEYVIQMFKNKNLELVPREVNIRLSKILEEAMYEEVRPITKEYVKRKIERFS
jgi:hypothetical protein